METRTLTLGGVAVVGVAVAAAVYLRPLQELPTNPVAPVVASASSAPSDVGEVEAVVTSDVVEQVAPAEPRAPEHSDFRFEPEDGAWLVSGTADPNKPLAVLVNGVEAGRVDVGPDGRFLITGFSGYSDVPRWMELVSDPDGAAITGLRSFILSANPAPVSTAPPEPERLAEPDVLAEAAVTLENSQSGAGIAEQDQIAVLDEGVDAVEAVEDSALLAQDESVAAPEAVEADAPQESVAVIEPESVEESMPQQEIAVVEGAEFAVSEGPAAEVAMTQEPEGEAVQDDVTQLAVSTIAEPIDDPAEAVEAEAVEAEVIAAVESETLLDLEPEAPATQSPVTQSPVVQAQEPPVAEVLPIEPQAQDEQVAETVADEPIAPESETPPSPAVPVILSVGQDGVEVIQPAIAADSPPEVMSTVALDTISYDLAGDVVLSGRAPSEGFVQVYVDNAPISRLPVAQDGTWSTDLPDVDTGVYTLRIDEVDTEGTVVSRIETPFQREAAEDVVEAMADQVDDPNFTIATRTVQPGATLWAIAEERYGSGVLYVNVFEANRDRIRNPDLIYPGQVFVMPESSN